VESLRQNVCVFERIDWRKRNVSANVGKTLDSIGGVEGVTVGRGAGRGELLVDCQGFGKRYGDEWRS